MQLPSQQIAFPYLPGELSVLSIQSIQLVLNELSDDLSYLIKTKKSVPQEFPICFLLSFLPPPPAPEKKATQAIV